MPIVRTPTEYRAALLEIEILWGSEPGTEEAKRLEEYLSAVDQYERSNTSAQGAQELA